MKVSVRIITYNHENYIEECIESVLKQKTDFEFEIIIGDDFSTDNTRKILEKYKIKFPNKFKLIFHTKNHGGRYNLLSTLTACEGDYIALLDGDDYWIDELKLQKQIQMLEQNLNYSICCHNATVIKTYNNATQTFENKIDKDTIYTTSCILKEKWFIMTSSMVFRNPKPLPDWFLNPTNKNIDYSLQLYLSLKGDIIFMKDVMSVYRIHNDSISLKFKVLDWCNSHLYIFKNFDFITNKKYIKLTNSRRSQIYFRIIQVSSLLSKNLIINILNYFYFKENRTFYHFKLVFGFLAYKYYNLIKGKKIINHV